MKSTRFAEVLCAIKAEDAKLLEEFIASPALNKNKRITGACPFIKERVEAGTAQSITKPELRSHAFGAGKTSDANFRVFVSDFTRLLERFLAYKELNPYEDIQLITMLGREGLEKSFQKHAADTHQTLLTKKAKDTIDYYKLYAIESGLLTEGNPAAKMKRIDGYVDLVYLSMKLDTAIRLEMQGMKWEDAGGLIKKGYVQLDINKKEHPFIYAKLIALSLVKGELKSPLELEHLAQKYKNERDLYAFACDILLWHYRKTGNHKKEFALLVELEIYGVLELTPKLFLLMIDAGLAAGELVITNRIVRKYKDKLKEKNAVNLVAAKVELYKKNYEAALKAAASIKITEPFYYKQVAEIKLHCFKSMGDKDSYRYTLDALKHWERK